MHHSEKHEVTVVRTWDRSGVGIGQPSAVVWVERPPNQQELLCASLSGERRAGRATRGAGRQTDESYDQLLLLLSLGVALRANVISFHQAGPDSFAKRVFLARQILHDKAYLHQEEHD